MAEKNTSAKKGGIVKFFRETKAELKRSIRDYFKRPLSYYDVWYLSAEVINDKGDINPACWGRTRQEAIKKLKNILK